MVEKSLISAVLEKKHWAFTVFYNEIVDHFYSYLKSNFSISENNIYDIISNTFVKIWNKLDTFDKEKWNFETWVWTILRNTTKDFFKKKNESVFSDFEYVDSDWETIKLEDKIKDESDYMDILENDYKLEQIKQAMNNLSPLEREIVFLRYSEWKNLKEVADIVWLTEWNLRVKLHRLMWKLKKTLN